MIYCSPEPVWRCPGWIRPSTSHATPGKIHRQGGLWTACLGSCSILWSESPSSSRAAWRAKACWSWIPGRKPWCFPAPLAPPPHPALRRLCQTSRLGLQARKQCVLKNNTAFKLVCFKELVQAWLRVLPKSNFIGDPSGSRGSSVVCSSCCSENLRSCSIKRSMEEVKLRSLLLSQWTTKPPPPLPSSGLNTAESASAAGMSVRGRGRQEEEVIYYISKYRNTSDTAPTKTVYLCWG